MIGDLIGKPGRIAIETMLPDLRRERDIVRKIEETMTYPGQIKVTVIRETRAVEYAK